MHEAQKAAEAQQRTYERQVVVGEVERHKREEEAKAAAARARNTALRHEREGMVRPGSERKEYYTQRRHA